VYIALPLADLAQLVERLIRNQQVAGSSPAVGFVNIVNNLRLLLLLQKSSNQYVNYGRFDAEVKIKVCLQIV
jgi:hypothetical protein